ncbi:hypothetical protein ACF1B0_24055 [Streptomyces anandii]|uniref:hypothetical protein n=1 Tax=Streptomyces anandii TaxID=285454 RepID=UPI0036FC4153
MPNLRGRYDEPAARGGHAVGGLRAVKGDTWGRASAGTLGTVAAGIAVPLLFGRYETRVSGPLLPMRLFRGRALTVGTVITALDFFGRVGSALVSALTSAGVPAETARRLEGAGEAAVRGVAPVWDATPVRLREAVVEGSGNTFPGGLHTAAPTTAVPCLPGALTAALGPRGRAADPR